MSTRLKVLRIVNMLLMLGLIASLIHYANLEMRRTFPYYRERAFLIFEIVAVSSYLLNIITCWKIGGVVYDRPVKHAILAAFFYVIETIVVEIGYMNYAGPCASSSPSVANSSSGTTRSYSTASYSSSESSYPTRTVRRVDSCGMVHHHQVPVQEPPEKWRKVRIITPRYPWEEVEIEDRE